MKRAGLVIGIMVLFGCRQKDNDIKRSIAAHAKEELMFAGVNYRVHDGVVTLTGNSPSEELKNQLVRRLQSTGGVKQVIDHINIAPVILDNDFVLKQKVDSVLAGYGDIETTVKHGVVTLNGEAKKDEKDKLLQSVNQLPLSGVIDDIVVK